MDRQNDAEPKIKGIKPYHRGKVVGIDAILLEREAHEVAVVEEHALLAV